MRVTETIGPAWESMKRMLFRPFNIGTWFSFGVMFGLQSCAEGGGGNSNFRLPDLGGSGSHGGSGHPGTGSTSGLPEDSSNAIANLLPHDLLAGFPAIGTLELTLIAVVALVVAVPLVVLFYWLGSRGQMMSIRAVATGSSDVGESWRATEASGGRMMKFHFAVLGIALLVFVPLLGGGAALVIPAIQNREGFSALWPLLIPLALIGLLAVIPLAMVKSLGRNFVAPIMLKHDIGAREGWKRFWSMARGHVGALLLFWLIGFGFSIGAAIVGAIGGVVTCCLGFLPILHQTIMAPYYVFERAWTLEILASMSPDFDLRVAAPNPYDAGPYGGAPPNAGFYGPYGPPGGGGGYPGPGGYGGPGGGGGFNGPPPAGGFGSPPGG